MQLHNRPAAPTSPPTRPRLDQEREDENERHILEDSQEQLLCVQTGLEGSLGVARVILTFHTRCEQSETLYRPKG